MAVSHAGVLANCVNFEISVLLRDAVDVHGPITALSCDVFIEGVPSDALDKMIVFCDFVHAFP